ncbi:undecaprenyldiphospho-muramoylpentapeptide beta-N-acetylglucosaminyltransferase [Nitratireductor kimnyeongensis]|uniref:UDP-N-acetylglucosamine--N-acetylmuramyl-(pentapeptide) pyrophosphoryl-undecaprenol N-acetylglucosamine transferase n=1 Tax=Nitratireductor kimnyeongensis TaxID=430679 RepID=A0ABW0T8V7_9HYPH|nr:undecaprenyldiphospho-muramoylpentapeptide beta-N-acetylglucosaminyltransferase [Nitratireductor kimnyeongensis]QZZ35925.1 undecaprenyldiphospho-muramoylpentapeptide beta-N-acetylglucosaminyltransferase [Nitratireductor kimnyeongensis]
MGKGTILLAAGGTGGHLFPAEALAHALRARGWRVHLATDKRAARFSGDFPAEETHVIESATFGSKNPIALLKAGWTIWRGVKQASALLQRLKPAAVVGFGGYPTLPPLWAATRRGIPAMIHEQNAVMGRANKALAARVQAIAGGFLAAEGPFADKIIATGNPVRPAVIEAAGEAYRAAGSQDVFRLLVFGGSQGAQFFSDAIPAAIAQLAPKQIERLVVTQQARPEDEADVRAAYEALGVPAEVSTFFNDMARRIAESHLVISRSGASTVSEIAAIGRPAFLVPYPHALDHDQAANAAALGRAGGAELHPQATLGAERLAELIGGAMEQPQRLTDMAAAAHGVGKTNAATLLADLVEAIASGQSAKTVKEGSHA